MECILLDPNLLRLTFPKLSKISQSKRFWKAEMSIEYFTPNKSEHKALCYQVFSLRSVAYAYGPQ